MKSKGVYLIVFQKKVVYVGRCIKSYFRIKTHFQNNGFKKFEMIIFIPVVDKEKRLEMEKDLIKLYRPRNNRQHNPDFKRVLVQENPRKYIYKNNIHHENIS